MCNTKSQHPCQQNGDIESGYQVGDEKGERSSAQSESRLALRSFLCSALKMLTLGATLAALIALFWYFMGLQSLIQVFIVLALYKLIFGGGYRWFYIAAVTTPRDLKGLIRYISFLLNVRSFSKKNMCIGAIFRQHAARKPDKVCFIFEDVEWTRAQVEEYSNKVANLFLSHGYRKGDTVALMLENRPEYVCIWLGLSKIGVITALINYNLRQTSLVHSINVTKAQAFIFGEELTDAVREISSNLVGVRLYSFSGGEPRYPHVEIGERQLKPLLEETSSEPPPLDDVGFHDRLIYIYTSGTTGLPKAAVITHARYVFLAGAMGYQMGFRESDVFYMPLPLYHTAGGCMNVGQALVYGASVVIRKKFSASAYFPDIVKYNCTISQYIGEMCRYLLATPSRPEDVQHKLRVVFGNGLRPQIWEDFVKRFRISQVGEFYGATEGNANIANNDNTVGAIGFVSRIIPTIYPISIIKVDQYTGEPIRDGRGLCIPCQAGEPGVFIGKINPNNPARAFLGYVNEKESEKKIVHDVFKKGDAAFLSGDIIVSDERGYLYFKDRTGDTFRWKGENVSTSEVEGIVSNVAQYRDCVVYGIEIPGSEGRAGMAAILDKNNSVDLASLSEGIRKALPSYARPIFIRLLHDVEMTGTYKLKKLDLQKEGFNPAKIKDKLYYMLPNGSYELLTPDVYAQIEAGKLRL